LLNDPGFNKQKHSPPSEHNIHKDPGFNRNILGLTEHSSPSEHNIHKDYHIQLTWWRNITIGSLRAILNIT